MRANRAGQSKTRPARSWRAGALRVGLQMHFDAREADDGSRPTWRPTRPQSAWEARSTVRPWPSALDPDAAPLATKGTETECDVGATRHGCERSEGGRANRQHRHAPVADGGRFAMPGERGALGHERAGPASRAGKIKRLKRSRGAGVRSIFMRSIAPCHASSSAAPASSESRSARISPAI